MPGVQSVAVIVSTYNTPHLLRCVLRCLGVQSQPPQRVYVADDGSGESTRQVIAEFQSSLPIEHVWHPDRGFRLAEIRNKAIAACREEYIIFLDGDCLPDRRFVEDHANSARPGQILLGTRCGLQGFDQTGLDALPGWARLAWLFITGRVLNDCRRFSDTVQMRFRGLIKGLRSPWPILRGCSVMETRGGNFSAWRSDLEQVNGFDQEFVGWGNEDRDCVDRMRRNGVAVRQILGHAVCYHLDHPSNAENTSNQTLFESARPIRCRMGLTGQPT